MKFYNLNDFRKVLKKNSSQENNRKYYVELTVLNVDAPYALQTKWVNSVEEALDLIETIDFVDPEQIQINIMYADWDEEEDYYEDIAVYADLIISNGKISQIKVWN